MVGMRKDTAIIYYIVEALEKFLYFTSRDLCARFQIPCSSNLNLRFQSGCFHMLKLSKFNRGNYECFKTEIIKARNAQLELLITGCSRLSTATASDMQHKPPREFLPNIAKFSAVIVFRYYLG